jgi:DNA-binding beta-propeller fold protein YncE
MRFDRARALLCLIALSIVGCVADPPITTLPPVNGELEGGVLVVNEGVWFQDNSTLTYYDAVHGDAVQDFFARQNPGERLGDTGNDIVVRGDRAYIVVTTSQNVEVIELPTGRSKGRLRVGRGDPRKLAIVNDSTGYVTLLEADAVLRFDPRTLVAGERTSVGPAPEGIATLGGNVFVANSGKAFLRRDEPKAGTVSVLDAATASERALLAPGPNPVSVRADSTRHRIYVLYGMPHADSIGGVAAFDATTLAFVARWEVKGAGVAGEMALDEVRGRLYVIDGGGMIERIDVTSAAPSMRFDMQPAPSVIGYYGIGVSPSDGAVYASYVTSYTLPGAVLVFEPSGAVRDRFDAGLNPSAFGFF